MVRLVQILLLSIAGMLLSGCATSNAYRSSVAEFGQLTGVTAAAQRDSLQIIIDDEKERVASALARDKVELILKVPECLPAPAGGNAPCGVKRRDGKPLETAASFSHILALGDALEDYAQSLVTLSADISADKGEFARSLAEAANSVAGLDSAVRDALQAEQNSRLGQQLGSAASIAASLGNIYFEYRRDRALKGIITRSDPVVQAASELLQHAYSMDQLYKQTGLLRTVQGAERDARRVAANPNSSEREMRAAQERLFQVIAQFNAAAQGQDRFDAVGKAHGELAVAARAGASKEDLVNVATSLFKLAQTVGDALPEMRRNRE